MNQFASDRLAYYEPNACFPWSDNERYWNGFLVDLCVQEVTPIFHQMGYSAHVTAERQDSETVLEAWKEDRTVVTVNENHFVRDTLTHQERDSGKNNCNGALGAADPLGSRREALTLASFPENGRPFR
jgi:hypothetical protein